MRILCVIDHFGSGGAQRQLVALASGLQGRGHNVICLAYFPEFGFFRSLLDRAGVRVHLIRKQGRMGINVLFGLRRLLREERIEVVISYMETPSLYAELASVGLPVRVIASERTQPIGSRMTAYLCFRSIVHRAADAVVANSGASREVWARLFPGLKSRLVLIRNGLDLSHFCPTALPAKRDGIQLVAVGTVSRLKNVHGLVSALCLVRARGGAVPHVTWVGKDESGTDGAAYRESMNALLVEHGLQCHWRWAGEQDDVRPFLAGAHALIHPSFREGLANVICEALAAGRPVLASDIGDNPWLIGREERGMLFDPRNAGSMADVMVRFSGLPDASRASMGFAGRTFAERELAVDKFLDGYENLLKQQQSSKAGDVGGV